MTIHLCGLPAGCRSEDRRTGRPYPTFGLAPGGVCRAIRVTPDAGALLPHRFTLACARRTGPSAVCSLWHFPAGRPDWPLTSTSPGGVPTFLEPVHVETCPARGHPDDSPSPDQCATVRVEGCSARRRSRIPGGGLEVEARKLRIPVSGPGHRLAPSVAVERTCRFDPCPGGPGVRHFGP